MRPLYEIQAEPDDGWRIPSGERWRGWRLRYREMGTRRWTTLLLEIAPEHLPTVAELQEAVHLHATRNDKGEK